MTWQIARCKLLWMLMPLNSLDQDWRLKKLVIFMNANTGLFSKIYYLEFVGFTLFLESRINFFWGSCLCLLDRWMSTVVSHLKSTDTDTGLATIWYNSDTTNRYIFLCIHENKTIFLTFTVQIQLYIYHTNVARKHN